MTETGIVSAVKSPLTLFRETLAQGGLPTTATGPRARAFPPRLAADGGLGSIGLPVRSGTVFGATRIETRTGVHVLALIDLDGGGRLLARLRTDDGATPPIGRAVTLEAEPTVDEPPLTFELRSEGDVA